MGIKPRTLRNCLFAWILLCSALSQATVCENHVTHKPGLYESIPTERNLILSDGTQVTFDETNKSARIASPRKNEFWMTFPKTNGKGYLEAESSKDQLTLSVIVLPPEAPRWIQAPSLTSLTERGIPTAAYLGLRSMKLLGIQKGTLKSFVAEKVRHAESILLLAQELKAWHQTTHKMKITVEEFLEMYKKTPIHRYNMTLIEQSGHRVVGYKLNPDARWDTRWYAGTTEVWTKYAQEDHPILPFPRLESWDVEMISKRWPEKLLDAKLLARHVEELARQRGISEDDLVPMDFSVLYELAPL